MDQRGLTILDVAVTVIEGHSVYAEVDRHCLLNLQIFLQPGRFESDRCFSFKDE